MTNRGAKRLTTRIPRHLPAGPPADAGHPDSPAGYVIEQELGRGGMGVVYLARQTALNRRVAVKMILSGDHAAADDLARFRAEAEAIAQLEHPNIVRIHEIGHHHGRPFFTLEYCEGGSLDRKLGGRPLPPTEAAVLAETLARAVDAAHQKGIVHRDLKPQNILLTADGTPKVTDFGLAKLPGRGRLTLTGEVMGSPNYMAPEQAVGGNDVGPAADVYALGAILYEMLTGRPPVHAASPLDTIMRLLSDELVPPRHHRPDVPRDLEAVCLKCLELDPRRRYPVAGEAAADLGRFLRGESVRARPMSFRKRLNWWCHHPGRVRDAGTFSIFLMLAITAWAVCGLLAYAATPAPADGGTVAQRADAFAIPHFVGLVEGLFLPLFVTGLGAIRGRVWALWAGLGLSVAGLTLLTMCLAGVEPLVRELDVDQVWGGPRLRFFALGFPVVLCGITAGAYFVALFSYHFGWSRPGVRTADSHTHRTVVNLVKGLTSRPATGLTPRP